MVEKTEVDTKSEVNPQQIRVGHKPNTPNFAKRRNMHPEQRYPGTAMPLKKLEESPSLEHRIVCPPEAVFLTFKEPVFEFAEVELKLPMSRDINVKFKNQSITILFETDDRTFYDRVRSSTTNGSESNGCSSSNSFQFVLKIDLYAEVTAAECLYTVLPALSNHLPTTMKLKKKCPVKWTKLCKEPPYTLTKNGGNSVTSSSFVERIVAQSPRVLNSSVESHYDLKVTKSSLRSGITPPASPTSSMSLGSSAPTPIKNGLHSTIRSPDSLVKSTVNDHSSSGDCGATNGKSHAKQKLNFEANTRSDSPSVTSLETYATAANRTNESKQKANDWAFNSPALELAPSPVGSPQKITIPLPPPPVSSTSPPDSSTSSSSSSSSLSFNVPEYPSQPNAIAPSFTLSSPTTAIKSTSSVTSPVASSASITSSVRQIQISHQYPIGQTGLRNLGNTCFMNSTLQCLSNTELLRDYFLCEFQDEHLNTPNPFGSGGRIAKEFAKLLQELWSGRSSSYSPHTFKQAIGRKCSQFADYAQHDAVEFMEHFLDVLHEDVNKVDRTKPIANEPIENEDQLSDQDLSEEQWKRFRRRNDSIITDIFYGQFKSKLTCPDCSKESITFDPFLYMAIPMTKAQVTHRVFYFALDADQPQTILVKLPRTSKVSDMLHVVALKTEVSQNQLDAYEYFENGRLGKQFRPKDVLPDSSNKNSRLLIFQRQTNGLVTYLVQQRLKHALPIRRTPLPDAACGFCNVLLQKKMKFPPIPCPKCSNNFFCSQLCLENDAKHVKIKHNCVVEPTYVGWPFIISVNADEMNPDAFMQMLKAKAVKTIDLIESPQSQQQPTLNSQALNTSNDSIHEALEIKEGDTHSDHEMESNEASAPSCNGHVPATTNGQSVPVQSARMVIEQLYRDFGFRLSYRKVSNDFYSKEQEEEVPVMLNDDESIDKINDKLKDAYFLLMEWDNLTASVESNDENHMEVDPIGRRVSNNAASKAAAETMFARDYSGNDRTNNEYTLEDSISKFAEPETLSMQEAWMCPQCKKPREASKELTIWRPPPILIIQLKRFSYNSMVREKINNFVKFPVQGLDISKFCSDPKYKDDHKPIYDLYGVIDHYGNLYGGHYTASANSTFEGSELGWRQFDDSHVSTVEPKVSQSAYVLFYKLRSASSS